MEQDEQLRLQSDEATAVMETFQPTRILINNEEIVTPHQKKGFQRSGNKSSGYWNLFGRKTSQHISSMHSKNRNLKNTFWCSQIIFMRIVLLGCFFSFVVSWHQNIALLGKNGLTPAKDYVDQMKFNFRNETLWTRFQNFHSLFLFLPPTDFIISLLPLIGIALTSLGLFCGYANVLVMGCIYIILQSIYSIGNIWFNYSYELELLEIVFMSLFMVPLSKNSLKRKYSTTIFMRFVSKFFVFKVLLGSGLIRMKNEKLWKDLLGKYYIYETHPLPTIVSYYFHYFLLIAKADNIFSIFVELFASFFILLPIRFCRITSGLFIFFYCILNFFTGNSYLFYFLLLAPLMFCFDDAFLIPFFFKTERNEILNIVKHKIIQRTKTNSFFKSFDIIYVFGFTVEDLNQLRDIFTSLEHQSEIDKQETETETETETKTKYKKKQKQKQKQKEEEEEKRERKNTDKGKGANENEGEGEGEEEINEHSKLLTGSNRTNKTHNHDGTNAAAAAGVVAAYDDEDEDEYESSVQYIENDINNMSNDIYRNKKESTWKNIKTDIEHFYEWVFKRKGVSKFLIAEKEISYEILFNIIFSAILFIYNFLLVSVSITFLNFCIFVVLFMSFAFYLFVCVENKIAISLSQFSILFMLFILYSNELFFHGLRNVYYVSLFFIYSISLLYLSTFYLKNTKFVCKFVCQYFYFILFLHFVVSYLQNITSPNQVMNSTYGHFEFMNMYGSFGKIKKQRQEIIIEGTTDRTISEETQWKMYEFNCKPGNVNKKPCTTPFRFVSYIIPTIYIDRLDWQFSLLSENQDEQILNVPWFKKFLIKLAQNDKDINSILYINPFATNYNNNNNINYNNNNKDQNKEIEMEGKTEKEKEMIQNDSPFYIRILNKTYAFSYDKSEQWWQIKKEQVIVKPFHVSFFYTKKDTHQETNKQMKQMKNQSNSNGKWNIIYTNINTDKNKNKNPAANLRKRKEMILPEVTISHEEPKAVGEEEGKQTLLKKLNQQNLNGKEKEAEKGEIETAYIENEGVENEEIENEEIENEGIENEEIENEGIENEEIENEGIEKESGKEEISKDKMIKDETDKEVIKKEEKYKLRSNENNTHIMATKNASSPVHEEKEEEKDNEKRKAAVSSFELSQIFLNDEQTKNILSKVTKNPYKNFTLLNKYTNKIKKLGFSLPENRIYNSNWHSTKSEGNALDKKQKGIYLISAAINNAENVKKKHP